MKARVFTAAALPIATTTALFVGAEQAEACSCAEPQQPLVALENADAVFRAEVTSIEQPAFGCGGSTSSADPIRVRFAVSRVWKGDVAAETEVLTARDEALCGFPFADGEEYLVYAYEDDEGDLRVSLCSRTRLIADADEDLDALGAGTSVALTMRRARPTQKAHAGIVGLLLVALACLRRFRM